MNCKRFQDHQFIPIVNKANFPPFQDLYSSSCSCGWLDVFEENGYMWKYSHFDSAKAMWQVFHYNTITNLKEENVS